MRRTLLPAVVLIAAVSAGPALGLVAAPPAPAQAAVSAQVVVAAKVMAVEEKLVEAKSPYSGATDTQSYKVAVVKVETALIGADKLKEIRVGVFQPPKPPPGGPRLGRGPAAAYELKEGQQVLLFLNKHPHADFYIPAGWGAPPDLSTDAGKKALDEVKRVAAILADPKKALTSDKPEARGEAAAVMVAKYRSAPAFGGDTEQMPIDADESKLILKALLDGEWKQEGRFGGPPGPFTASYQLNLTKADGWVEPVIAPSPPGVAPPDFAGIRKDAFAKWLAGPGKDYRVKKLVPKAAPPK
jgi:hypothetical protein